LVLGSLRHEQSAAAPHLFMQHSYSIACVVIGAKRVRTDKLSEAVGLVRIGAAIRAHLMQDDRYASIRRLPRRFAASHAAADNMDRFDAHHLDMRLWRAGVKPGIVDLRGWTRTK
jgi:hypothetical protein